MLSGDGLQSDKRRVAKLEVVTTVLVVLIFLSQLLWGFRLFWTLIGFWAVAWALIIWRYRLMERIRGKRFRTGLRMLVFVVWFAFVAGVAFLLGPLSDAWALGFTIASVVALMIAAGVIISLEDREI
jgi:hypothetical protein